MVFGWGKKKQKTIEPTIGEGTEKRQITLAEVPTILDNLKKLRTRTIITEAKSLRETILPRLNELAQIANTLEKDNLDVDDLDKNLKLLVVRGKKQVIQTITSTIKDKKNRPDIDTINDVVTFSEELGQSLKKIGDALGRHSRVIHIFAKKYANKLKNILADVNSEKSELFKIVDSYKNFDQDVSEINMMITKIQNTKRTISEKNDRRKELEKELQEFLQRIEYSEKSIKEIKSSQEYITYRQLCEKIQDVELDKLKIKQDINNQFTKISRPLSKYVYVSSLDKEQKSLLQQLVENPIDAIRAESKNDIIVILQSVRKGILSGSVSVKDVDKSILYIDETTEMIEQFIKEISEFLNKYQKLKDQVTSFDLSKLDDVQFTLEKDCENKTDCENKIKTLESEINEYSDVQSQLLPKIQQTLQRISSIRYSISE